jgi:Tfp pilus assembly protein PilP
MRALVLSLMAASIVAGQTPATPNASIPMNGPTPPVDYGYTPDGRRDPFVSLVNRGSDTRASDVPRTRPDGIAGILVDEVVVRGILQSQGTWVAMIGSPSGRTYSIRSGDRLMDGQVKSIVPQAVVLSKEINEPLSVEKQREVRKYLRGEVK